MIENLTCVIEDKTHDGRFPGNFGEQLRNNSSSFRDAKRFINGYISNEKIPVPTYIKHDKVMKNVHNFRTSSSSLNPAVRYHPPVSGILTRAGDQYTTTTTRYEVTETIKTNRIEPGNFGEASTTTNYKLGGGVPPPPPSVSFSRPSEPLGFNATAVRASEYVPSSTISPPHVQP